MSDTNSPEQPKDGICKGKALCGLTVVVDFAFCNVCGWYDDPVITPDDPYEGNQLITTNTQHEKETN